MIRAEGFQHGRFNLFPLSIMASPSLVDLADRILRAANALQQGLHDKHLSQPSFDSTGPQDYHDASEFPALRDARAQLIEATHSLLLLALGPTDVLRSLVSTDRTNLMVLTTIARLKIAETVPLDSAIAIEKLADQLQLHVQPLKRILGYAYTMHIFREPQPGFVAHTSLSVAIPAFSPFMWIGLHPSQFLGGLKLAESLQIQSARANDAKPAIPLQIAQPQYPTWWSIVNEEPDGMQKFTAAMRTVGQAMVGPKYTQYVQGFDWKALGDALVVDLGGGDGHISSAIAQAYPNLTIIIQDLNSNADLAKAYIPAELQDRVSFQIQDFFQPQPKDLITSPPKVYLLSRILHDWSDQDCKRILDQLLPAVEKGTKLFIVDRIVPNQVGEIPLYQEALIRSTDLMMYTLLGGKERSLSEWESLFKSVDSRLAITRSEIPMGSEMGLLEVAIDNLQKSS